jgi:hypothetical protein
MINADLLKTLEAIPDKKTGMPKEFTPEMDEAIRRFYRSKPKKPLARALGISTERLKERYVELTGGTDEGNDN